MVDYTKLMQSFTPDMIALQDTQQSMAPRSMANNMSTEEAVAPAMDGMMSSLSDSQLKKIVESKPVKDSKKPQASSGQSTPQYQGALNKELMGGINDQLGKQEAGIEDLEQASRDIEKIPLGMDFTPMAAWIDSIDPDVKSNLAGAAASSKGMMPEEKLKLKLAMKKQLATEKAKMTNSKLMAAQTIKSMMSGGDGKMTDREKAAEKKERLMVSKRAGFEIKAVETAEKVYDKFQPIFTQFQAIENAFASGDAIRLKQIVGQYARLIAAEKGVLTDKDVTRINPKNIYTMAADIENFFSKDPDAPLPQKFIDKMMESVHDSKIVFREVFNRKLDRGAKQYGRLIGDERGTEIFGFVKKDVNELLGGESTLEKKRAAVGSKKEQLKELFGE